MKPKHFIAAAALVGVFALFFLKSCDSPSQRPVGSKEPQSARDEGSGLGGSTGLGRGDTLSALAPRQRSILDPDVHLLTPRLEVSPSLDGLLTPETRTQLEAIMAEFVEQLNEVERTTAEFVEGEDESYLRLKPSEESRLLVDRTVARLHALPEGQSLVENFLRGGVAIEQLNSERHLFLEKVAQDEDPEAPGSQFQLIVEHFDAITGQSYGRSMDRIDLESENPGELADRYAHLIDIAQTAKTIEEVDGGE